MAWPDDIEVKDADNVKRALPVPNTNGRRAADQSRPTVWSDEDLAAINLIATRLGEVTDTDIATILEAIRGFAASGATAPKQDDMLARFGNTNAGAADSDTADASAFALFKRLLVRLSTLITSSGGVEALLTEIRDSTAPAPVETTLKDASGLTNGNVSQTGSGATQMVAAASGETTRLHRYTVTVPGAGTVEIRDNTTAIRKHIFPAAGGIVREFSDRPHAKTTANTALNFYWSGSGEANIDFEYVRSA
jgi:hypothetical protein